MSYPAGFLLIYFLVYLAVAFVWRSVLVYRRTGIHPIRLPATDDVHGYVGTVFKGFLFVCVFYLLFQAFAWNGQMDVSPAGWLYPAWVHGLGWGMLMFSGAVLLWAQAQMGVSWRIGLDAETPGPLVTQGLFAHSRNPIFLSMRLNLLGLLFLLPNMFTLLLLVCGELLIQIQVRLEEAHLPQIYGAVYEAYRARVPRWW